MKSTLLHWFGVLLFLIGCGEPMAPAGSVTISGQVQNQASAAAGLEVSAGGQTTTTDTSGQFVLETTASDATSVRIQGVGIDQTVSLGGLASGAEVDVTIDVGASAASLARADIALTGTVSAIALPDLTVDGMTVVTSTSTEVEEKEKPIALTDLAVGDVVRVEGTLAPDQSVTALEIERSPAATDVEIEGTVQSVSPPMLTIAGRAIATDANTLIFQGLQRIALGAVQPGFRAHVRGTLESDGTTVLAQTIRVAPGFTPHVLLVGDIGTITPPGTLVISGLTVTADASTQIKQGGQTVAFSALVVGEEVLVSGVPQPDGTILAQLIAVHPSGPPVPPPEPDVDLRGVVQAVTSTSLQLDGTTVDLDAQTRFAGAAHSLADIAAGDFLAVEGSRNADGSVQATLVIKLPLLPPIPLPVALRGSISAVGTGQLTVAGKTVMVTSTTVIRQGASGLALADLKVGEEVEVVGTAQADGTVTALRIQVTGM